MGIAECGLWNSEFGFGNAECGIQNSDLGMRIVEFRIRIWECGLWNSDLRMRNVEFKSRDTASRIVVRRERPENRAILYLIQKFISQRYCFG
ncbi:MAG: hypothetical protein D6732_22990 [Methanobacteriota archaeon]|nr:MAG: hypothetical protein D6732_22990 [Euryarchaeota archaeon]